MPIFYRLILSFSFLFCFTQAQASESLEKIVLPFPWYHQFQFAGYYAAVEQGYYKEVLSLRPDMPIIVCTGYSTTLSKEGAMEIGIKRYLNKPVEGEELVRNIRSVLDQEYTPVVPRVKS